MKTSSSASCLSLYESHSGTFKSAVYCYLNVKKCCQTVTRLGSRFPVTAFTSLSLLFVRSLNPPLTALGFLTPVPSALCYSSRPVMHQIQSCPQNIMRVPAGLSCSRYLSPLLPPQRVSTPDRTSSSSLLHPLPTTWMPTAIISPLNKFRSG